MRQPVRSAPVRSVSSKLEAWRFARLRLASARFASPRLAWPEVRLAEVRPSDDASARWRRRTLLRTSAPSISPVPYGRHSCCCERMIVPGRGPVVPGVLQAHHAGFGGTGRWDRWDHHERRSAWSAPPCARRSPLVPLGGTACSRQILWSTTGPARPPEETVQRNEDGIGNHDGSVGRMPAVSSSILRSTRCSPPRAGQARSLGALLCTFRSSGFPRCPSGGACPAMASLAFVSSLI
jgi:hypothetical protein